MVWVRSISVSTVMLGGMEARSFGSMARMASTVSMTLAPGSLLIASRMVRPLAMCEPGGAPAPAKPQAAPLLSSGASTAMPMSFTRTGAPLRQARIRSFQGPASSSWSLV